MIIESQKWYEGAGPETENYLYAALVSLISLSVYSSQFSQFNPV